jgi:tetratricopeptide (TPR) repeat protein
MMCVAATWQPAAAKRRGLLAAWWHAERRGRARAARAARARQVEMQTLATLALALERWLWPRRRAERLAALRVRVRCRLALAALRRPAAVQQARRRLERLARLRLQRRCFGGLRGFASLERRYHRLLRPLQGLPESAVQHEHARPSRPPRSPSKVAPRPLSPRSFMAGVRKQKALEMAEELARRAENTGDAYEELLAEGARHKDNHDCRRAAMSYREAIAVRPNKPEAYLSLGGVLADSGHQVEAAQRFLEAKELLPASSSLWAVATASAFESLRLKANSETPKPEWWNDTGLKALSARVVTAAPNGQTANHMRAMVLTGAGALLGSLPQGSAGAWEVGARSAAELEEAATHWEQAAALCVAPAMKAEYTRLAGLARRQAGATSTRKNGRR